ncbi:phosphoenolpyruvate carboxylase [Pseudomonas sp. Pse1]|uniref:phosphoenolpyruvate carboxylase n=1 Tax=Pseudomonas sp. Pse1 TaxID=2926020 RepID=UPI0021180D78
MNIRANAQLESPQLLIDPRLRRNVNELGTLLGNTIQDEFGTDLLQKIEAIRQGAKRARTGEAQAQNDLLLLLHGLKDEELLPVSRAFNQFLNLANIAEQHHQVRKRRPDEATRFADSCFSELISRLRLQGYSAERIHEQVSELKIDLVLTAHPTEVTRRTLIQKYDAIAHLLDQSDRDLSQTERATLDQNLARLIDEIWHTSEIRKTPPTPVDEAKWGFALIENTLWEALPLFLRSLDTDLSAATGKRLSLSAVPVRFSSWMGGDRDGNPNVTAAVTHEVLLLGRWMAADLYLRDIDALSAQLSMSRASEELLLQVNAATEPYRAVLKPIREQLHLTLEWAQASIQGNSIDPNRVFHSSEELLAPLELCYRSLCSQGLSRIADGLLLDTIRRVRSFGLGLARLDIRQDSGLHSKALTELTEYLSLGRYEDWDEQARRTFLLTELQAQRQLIPEGWEPSAETTELLACCRAVALQPDELIGSYVISMAKRVSDVLAVKLLLKACGLARSIPVVPLFETLDDLKYASTCIDQLLEIDGYRAQLVGSQEVMIGYSDSAKDAGTLAAAWAQYQAQENLVAVCQKHNVGLRLFHGRGGTIGRGGAPAHQAILSQPPGSVAGELRVTEQGEMIRFKFGVPDVAIQSLRLYLSAVLEAQLIPPPSPCDDWRQLMDLLADDSLLSYRSVVRDNPQFIDYFRQATPELELAKLPLGSRPARRRHGAGVEGLRAIPWIFAWTQNRLLLPAWLGAASALGIAILQGKTALMKEMISGWPFFKTRIDMLEMVLSKADIDISRFYEQCLVEPKLRSFGLQLRAMLIEATGVVLELKGITRLLEENPELSESMSIRNPYTDPLHLLQAELLSRSRAAQGSVEPSSHVDQALLVTFAGVAAGMRNTG